MTRFKILDNRAVNVMRAFYVMQHSQKSRRSNIKVLDFKCVIFDVLSPALDLLTHERSK